jgi:uncharacterized protein YndB with AHSA1/START domain
MASATPGPGLTLKVRRTFQAPVEKMWAAWTERGPLEQWMCRDKPDHRTKYRELDFREGGRYVIENTTAHGVFIGRGTYEQIKPLEKIVFTWSWQQGAESATGANFESPSRVTVEFQKRGEATELLLTHELLPNEAEVASHESGWNGCFDVLTKYLKSPN